MFNTIINAFNPKPIENIDFDAEYEAMIRDMNEAYQAERAAIRSEWSSLSVRERNEAIADMDEMAIVGNADSHRFYPYWKARRI